VTNSNLPPRPWTYVSNTREGQHMGKGFVYLLDAKGRKIGTVWGTPDEKIAVAEMVCDAASSMDALRSIRAKVHAHNRGGGLTEKLRDEVRDICDAALPNGAGQ
jgi:hypothetical protein